MKTRIITSLVGIPLLLLALYFYNTFFFNVVIAALCVIAFYEIISAFHIKNPFWLYLAIVPMALMMMLSDHGTIRNIMPLVLFVFIVYLALCVIFEFKELSFSQISEVVLFCGIVTFGFYAIISFKIVRPFALFHYDSIFLTLLGFGYAWGGDSAAYFTGRALGKHKLAPKVSPNKTVEGAIGALGGSVALGCLFTWIYSLLLPHLEPGGAASISGTSYLWVALLGLAASILGIMGDLFTSAIKRQCGIKDYGSIFPGHGGILDRFDSVIFVMPFVSLVSRVLELVTR